MRGAAAFMAQRKRSSRSNTAIRAQVDMAGEIVLGDHRLSGSHMARQFSDSNGGKSLRFAAARPGPTTSSDSSEKATLFRADLQAGMSLTPDGWAGLRAWAATRRRSLRKQVPLWGAYLMSDTQAVSRAWQRIAQTP